MIDKEREEFEQAMRDDFGREIHSSLLAVEDGRYTYDAMESGFNGFRLGKKVAAKREAELLAEIERLKAGEPVFGWAYHLNNGSIAFSYHEKTAKKWNADEHGEPFPLCKSPQPSQNLLCEPMEKFPNTCKYCVRDLTNYMTPCRSKPSQEKVMSEQLTPDEDVVNVTCLCGNSFEMPWDCLMYLRDTHCGQCGEVGKFKTKEIPREIKLARKQGANQ